MPDEIYTLVASTNRGRYACDDSEHGHDLTTGEPISIEVLNGVWVSGRVEHASSSEGAPGNYSINDAGRPHPGAKMTQEYLQQQVSAARAEGMSLADALDAATGKTTGVFAGYYFISDDGLTIGLCTGMRVKLQR